MSICCKIEEVSPVSVEEVEVPGQEVEGLLPPLIVPTKVLFHEGDEAEVNADPFAGIQQDLSAFPELLEHPAQSM